MSRVGTRSLLIGEPPDLRHPGTEPETVPPLPRGDVGLRRSSLLDQFPDVRVGLITATSIAVPAGATFAAGEAAWYGLGEIRHRDVGTEFSLLSSSAVLSPTDPAGDNGAGWGAVDGSKALIVIGLDLPVRLGKWASRPSNIAGLGGAANPGVGGPRVSRYAGVYHFPPGSQGDEVKGKLFTSKPFAPGAVRVRERQRLCVALILDRVQAAAAANDELGVGITIELVLGLTQSDPFDVR